MSGAQPSTFAEPNVLLNTLSGLQTSNVVHNQLLNTEAQQNIAATDMEQVGRAASWIDTLPAEQKPQAYQAARTQLQAAGFAKNAPAEYPGDQAITMLARQSIPVPDQYKLGIVTPPGTAAAINAALGGGNPPAQGGQPPAQGSVPPGSGVTIGQRQNNPGNLTFAGQPGASPGQGNRFASFPDMPTGVAANADQLALYQTQHGINTVRGAVTRWVSDPKADLTSYIGDISKALGVGPDDKIDLTDPAVQAKFIQAQFPHESAGGGYVLNPADVAKGVQMSAANRGQRVQAPGTTVATTPPPAAPPGSAPAPGTYQVASNAPVAPPGSAAPATAAPVVAQGSQPPAPAPAAPAQPTGPQANLPHASEVPTGPSSPQYQQAMDLQRRAMILDAQPDPTGRLKTLAAGLRSQAALILQSDSVVNTQEGQLHTMTGKIDDPAKPLPHWTQNQNGTLTNASTGEVKSAPVPAEVWQKQPDGTYINQATGKPMSHYVYSPDAGGPGIPGYIDTTATNKPEINPARRMNVRPDGSVINDQGQVIAPAMPGATPPLGSFEVQKGDYEADRKLLPEIAAQGQNAQTAQVRLQTMLDLLPKISTGAGGYTRTQLANLAETAGFPGIAQTLIAHNSEGDAAAAQEFGKLTLAAAGAAERGDLGSRGSLGALKLYQQNNPSLDLRPGANKAMIGMQLIAAQADTDYSQAALAYANQHQNDFRTGKAPYQPLANFDLQWQQQKNPQVYAAAMGALNGQPPETWAKGLNMDDYNRALDIVARASPNAVVNTREGRKVMQQKTAATPPMPPGFSVVQ